MDLYQQRLGWTNYGKSGVWEPRLRGLRRIRLTLRIRFFFNLLNWTLFCLQHFWNFGDAVKFYILEMFYTQKYLHSYDIINEKNLIALRYS